MCNQQNIKALSRHMVMRAGGAKKAANICGVTEGELSIWCNDRHDRFIPADHLLDLDQHAGDLFLKEWARIRGYELIPPRPTARIRSFTPSRNSPAQAVSLNAPRLRRRKITT